MKETNFISGKIFTAEGIVKRAAQWRVIGKKIAFTNGVFDILHEGHIFSLSQAAKEADYLVVGLNSDASVKKLKGESRPVNKQESRALILASLIMVDG
ncbi:MAG: adenylyltransferase/cytidyltransferase family protein [Bacteroidota bacterium]